MSEIITTKFGEALPPRQRHAITFHLPEWKNLLRIMEKDETLFAQLSSVYPRMMPAHVDVKAVLYTSAGEKHDQSWLNITCSSLARCPNF
jgi:hypothetical protein